MSTGAAWFPCYSNDLLGSMRWKRMTPAQRGAYWQLICWQMQSEDGHFDDDIDLLSALADLDLRNGNAIVAEAFPVNENGRRANRRALEEWTKRRVLSETRSKIGKDGIAKRWQGHSKPDSKPIANATTSTSTSTGEQQEAQSEVKNPAQARITQPHGEFKKVKLTEDEYGKLVAVHGKSKADKGIELLDAYIESNGKRYRNHYAVLKENSWVWERLGKSGQANIKGKSWTDFGTGGL